MGKPTIDLDKLLVKLQTKHLVQSQDLATYSKCEREENMNAIAKLTMLSNVIHDLNH